MNEDTGAKMCRLVFRIEGHPTGDFEVVNERPILNSPVGAAMQFDILKREMETASQGAIDTLSRWFIVSKGAA